MNEVFELRKKINTKIENEFDTFKALSDPIFVSEILELEKQISRL